MQKKLPIHYSMTGILNLDETSCTKCTRDIHIYKLNGRDFLITNDAITEDKQISRETDYSAKTATCTLNKIDHISSDDIPGLTLTLVESEDIILTHRTLDVTEEGSIAIHKLYTDLSDTTTGTGSTNDL